MVPKGSVAEACWTDVEVCWDRACSIQQSTNNWLIITEFIKEDSPLLPNPCHFQDYDRSMFPLSLGPRDGVHSK